MCPSPSISAYLIISSTSSSVSFSPKFVITCLSSAAEMSPFPSLSKTLNASINYYSVSVSFIFLAINDKNSGKSIVPLPSASTSLIISWSSASVGFCPNDLITVPNYLVVIEPSPFLSKRAKASLNYAICSSFNWSAISKLNLYTSYKISNDLYIGLMDLENYLHDFLYF